MVQQELWEARSGWYRIGIGLGMEKSDLNSISFAFNSTNDRFTRMLSVWLQEYPSCTWSALITALKSPAVNLHALAHEIEIKYNYKVKEEGECNTQVLLV